MSKHQVELGDLVKDRITGYEGVVTGKHEYIFGCTQFSVTAQDKKTSKEERIRLFDEAALDIKKKQQIKAPPRVEATATAKPPGGPAQPIPEIER